MTRVFKGAFVAACLVFLVGCVSMPAGNPNLRISKIIVDMSPYIANEGSGAAQIQTEILAQANKRFAAYKGSNSDPKLIIQIKSVELASGFGTIRGARGNGTDAMSGTVTVDAGTGKIAYPITAEIQADDIIEPQAIVADFLGWTEKYVFRK